jgi:hypothetical protein
MYSATLELAESSLARHMIKEGEPMYVEFSDFPESGRSFRFEDDKMPWVTSIVHSVTYEDDEEMYYVHTENSTYTLEYVEEFDYEDRIVEFELDLDD